LSSSYAGKPILICMCFGGDIDENVRSNVEGFVRNNSKNGVTFEEWNGDKLASMILSSFMKEDILPEKFHVNFRKSLAMVEEPETSHKYYTHLFQELINFTDISNKKVLRCLQQVNLSLQILFSWCEESANLESAFLSAEYAVLNLWELVKLFFIPNTKLKKDEKQIKEVYLQILDVQLRVFQNFFSKIEPFSDKRHVLSSQVLGVNNLDINLKQFDLVGRLALFGIWRYWQSEIVDDKELANSYFTEAQLVARLVIDIVSNNPSLKSPLKDSQGIDIGIASWFLLLFDEHRSFLRSWHYSIIDRCYWALLKHAQYPSTQEDYLDLNEHPAELSDSYRKDMTTASILYPTLALFAGKFGFDETYTGIKKLKADLLEHCNFQLWYPNDLSERNIYTNKERHGYVLSHLLEKRIINFSIVDIVELENKQNAFFNELSAIRNGFYPIIFQACRHYRFSVPPQFISPPPQFDV
jgi:hypothetical protein